MSVPALTNLSHGPGIAVNAPHAPRQLVGADGQPAAEVAAPPATPAPKPQAEPTIEELLAATSTSNDPALAGGHTGVDWDKTLASLPEEARKLLGNLRADYTRKSQAVAEQTKRMESERKALTNSEAYKKLVEASKQETGEFDPYSPDSFIAKIKSEVSKQMLESLKPVVEKQQEDEARASVASFISEHPDLAEKPMKIAVAKELQANESITFEQAYWIVKGRAETTRAGKLETELGQYRQLAQQAGLRVATGTRPNEIRPPANVKGAVNILRWLQSQTRT